MDPYHVLNVRRNATAKTIVKAYRRAATKAHPDKGGSAEDFHRVNEAYRLLTDPAARAHYDATGETKPRDRRDADSALLSLLAETLGRVMTTLYAQGMEPAEEDLAEHMRAALDGRTKPLTEQLKTLRKAEKRINDTVGRFTTTEPENLLDVLICGQLTGVRQQIAGLEAEIERIRAAEAYLKSYSYRHEAPVRRVQTVKSIPSWLLGPPN